MNLFRVAVLLKVIPHTRLKSFVAPNSHLSANSHQMFFFLWSRNTSYSLVLPSLCFTLNFSDFYCFLKKKKKEKTSAEVIFLQH